MEAKNPKKDFGKLFDIGALLMLGKDESITFYRRGHVCYNVDPKKGMVKVAAGEDLIVGFFVGYACHHLYSKQFGSKAVGQLLEHLQED